MKTPLRTSLYLLAGIILLKIVVHALGISQYGYFRDELYYLASTRHLALGYVEHPPFSIYVLAAFTGVLGDSLFVIRGISILAGSGVVLLTGLMVREFGGRYFAQGLAALVIALAPVLLGTQHIYTMNSLDQLFWALAIFFLIRIIETGERSLWITLGFFLGLALMNKISVLWLGAGIALGLLLSPQRFWLATRWPWVAALIAVVMFTPHIVWQIQNGFPTLEFMRNASSMKMVQVGPLDFLKNQILNMNPFALPVVLAGVVGFVAMKDLRKWGILGIVFLTVCLILVLNGKSKSYYLAGAYPLIVAPGAWALERWLWRGRLRYVAGIYTVLLVLTGLAVTPFAIPLLPPESLIRYMHAMGMQPEGEERSRQSELPQTYADMHGWEELVAAVRQAYDPLSPEEKMRCSIFAQNYGEAGAIDVIGRRQGLPPAISGHNSYWLWGPGNGSGDIMIIIGGDPADARALFDSVEQVTVWTAPYIMPYERERPIYLCRHLKVLPRDLWPRCKMYI